ncbi:MAG TPA: UDP-N-acetylmuramoyl-L-alanine--D-glutamate ligase [bacterium]|nr:UDP-N-acetylmuramoyl-L-alanine--D-glutamate ligase [bacterium]
MINFDKYLNKKIAVLGIGAENEALLEWLSRKDISLEIVIYDRREAEQLADKVAKINSLSGQLKITWRVGEKSHEGMNSCNYLWRSPGWPIFCPQIQVAIKSGSQLDSPMNLFFEACPSKNIIGVTGSKGKGTTSSLIYTMIDQVGWPVFLGGNIGIAPFAFIDLVDEDSWVVLELSSFQLEDLRYSPRIAVVTNLYEEHLAPADPLNPNYHQSREDYWQAKQNIFINQETSDFLIINQKLENQLDTNQINSQIRFFGSSSWVTPLVGEHNKENIAAAQVVAEIIGLPEDKTRQAVAEFKGLEHRLEFVAEKNGVRYYDDSFATNPIATEIALKSFEAPIILFLGGADKGNDFKSLAKLITTRPVKLIILFDGQASPRIKADLIEAGYPEDKIIPAGSMESAMESAKQKAADGDIVLLSTACASFGIFNNYKERGNLFKQAV